MLTAIKVGEGKAKEIGGIVRLTLCYTFGDANKNRAYNWI